MIGCSIPIIAAERESPYKFNYLKNSKNKRLFFNMLKFSQKIIIQFKRYRFGYPKELGKKIISIPNPVILPALKAKLDVSKKKYHLLFVGRLTYQKNVQSLIKAFLVLQQNHKHKNWILDIVGDGEDKKILKKFVIDNNLDKKVIFHNNSNDVEKFYLNSDLFCLPSRWEGFPNALSEALSYGLPAVGFEICAGVSDLIKNNYNGLLASSKKSDSDLSNKLDEMMSSKNKRALYGKRSRQLMKKYDPDIIVNKWIKCFREIYK
jgi:glycosyltransferase involved in cell wall biosynthesis